MGLARCYGITKCNKRCKKKQSNIFCKTHDHQQEKCTICFDTINKLPKFVSLDIPSHTQLECGHKFCTNCILNWVCTSENMDCPLCRKQINEPTLIDNSVNYGILHKLYVCMDEYYISINNLSEQDLELIEVHGVRLSIYINKQEFENLKLPADILDKLKIFHRKCILRVNTEEEWEYFNKFNSLYLFKLI